MDLDVLYPISPVTEALQVNAFSLKKSSLRTASELREMAAGPTLSVSVH